MIKLIIKGKAYPVEQFTFSGGEVQVKVDPTLNYSGFVTIEATIKNSDDIMALLLTYDAIDRVLGAKATTGMVLKYFPYARQDRVCQEGEALSASVFTSLINSLDFCWVEVWDIHNEELLKSIDRVVYIGQELFVSPLVSDYNFIVSPDKGAKPKIQKLGVSEDRIIVGDKIRDSSNGLITETTIFYQGDIKNSKVLIVDDICDGGRTFIELAKVLKATGVHKVDLYVTHGIFSKGFEVFEGLIDHIYTTDSFYEGDSPKVKVLKL